MGPPVQEVDTIPADAVVSVTIENGEVPLIFAELVQNQQVLQHPMVEQLSPISVMEHDRELDLDIVSPNSYVVESDPNVASSNRHFLLPLATRAAYFEDFHKVRPYSKKSLY